MPTEKAYRVSGHESFPCRYAWLPKAVRGLRENDRLFGADEDAAMVTLGVGKNMVRSIRFWSHATGIAAPKSRGTYGVTGFGEALLGSNGLDEFIEDMSTLWLLHWNLSTQVEAPLLAWDFLVNRWQEPEFSFRKAADALAREAQRNELELSRNTIEQHLATFLHTYVPTRSRKGGVQEDSLDCPLVELQLLNETVGADGAVGSAKQEPLYAFRREEKPEIRPELFAYCLSDFWEKQFPGNETLPLNEVAHGVYSPGQVFKLPEDDIRSRAVSLADETKGLFTFSESSVQQQLVRKKNARAHDFLQEVYR